MKDLILIGMIGIALFYGSRVLGAKKLGDKSMVRVMQPRIVKTDGNGVLVRFDVSIDNPTQNSVIITKPVVTLSSMGKHLVSSIPDGKLYTIAPLSRTSLDFIDLNIAWSSLSTYIAEIITRIPDLIKEYRNHGRLSFQSLAIPLEYKYSTYVNELYYESPINQIV